MGGAGWQGSEAGAASAAPAALLAAAPLPTAPSLPAAAAGLALADAPWAGLTGRQPLAAAPFPRQTMPAAAGTTAVAAIPIMLLLLNLLLLLAVLLAVLLLLLKQSQSRFVSLGGSGRSAQAVATKSTSVRLTASTPSTPAITVR